MTRIKPSELSQAQRFERERQATRENRDADPEYAELIGAAELRDRLDHNRRT